MVHNAEFAVAEPAYRATSRDAAQSVSSDGRFVAFATDSGPSTDDNGGSDIYLRDRRTGTTEAISVAPDGRAGDGPSINPSISGDGRHVAFISWATDLAPDADGTVQDVFVRDRTRGTTVQVAKTDSSPPSARPRRSSACSARSGAS